jgi:ubiquitin carboxyl-terminal hydrolase 7
MDVQVATDESFRAHQGFDLVRWDEDPESGAHAKAYRVLRSTTISEFMSLVAKDMDTVPNLCRPWVMVNRQNRTVRPDQPIDLPNMTLDEVAHKYGTKSSLVRLWIEQAEEKDADGKAIWKKSNDATSPKTVLLFLKHFDIETQSLHGVGHFYVQGDDKIADVSSTILKMMNWPAGTPFKLYEVRPPLRPFYLLISLKEWQEIKQSMIEALKPKSTFSGSEIQDGDIIAVQKSLSDKE